MVKVTLELVLNKNGVTFLNFWDSFEGKDVTCEVKNGRLFLSIYVEATNSFDEKEITLQEFIDLVHEQRK